MDGVHVFASTRARHEVAPLLREREAYLAHLQRLGLKPRKLSSLSAMLLQVVRYLEIVEARQITLEQVTAAGTAWCNTTQRRWPPMHGPPCRKEFEGKARQFLRFSGLLSEPPPATNQFSATLHVYLNESAKERRLSAASTATACSKLRRFFGWLAPQCNSLAEVTIEHIDAYLTFKRQSCNARTICSEAAYLQDFFRFAGQRALCSGEISLHIRKPSLPKPRYESNRLQWSDVRKLFTSLDGHTRYSLRARAMCLLCGLYGLRSSEVAGLRMDSFDWTENTFSLTRAKRGRAQHYPILPELRDAVLDYLERGRPSCEDRGLFLSVSVPYRRVCPALVSYIVRARICAAGISASPAGAHTLRHACATELLRTGSSLQEIADFLGHRNLRTVSCYVRHDEAALREVAEFELGWTQP